MRTRKNRDHLDREALLRDIEADRLPALSSSHLERCPPCRRMHESYAGLVATLRQGRMPEPKAEALERAVAAFSARPPLSARIREVIARLVPAPLRLSPAHAGVRGRLASQRLVFSAAGLDVTLERKTARPGATLVGQVLAAEPSDLPVTAWTERGGERGEETPIEPDGMFVITGVPDRHFDLVLDRGERRIRIAVPGGGRGA